MYHQVKNLNQLATSVMTNANSKIFKHEDHGEKW